MQALREAYGRKDVSAVKIALADLKAHMQKIGEEIYKKSGGQPGAGNEGGAGGSGGAGSSGGFEGGNYGAGGGSPGNSDEPVDANFKKK